MAVMTPLLSDSWWHPPLKQIHAVLHTEMAFATVLWSADGLVCIMESNGVSKAKDEKKEKCQ